MAVATIILGKTEEGLHSLAVIRVLLAFEDHLLEAPDDLLLALLGHLLAKVLVGTAAVLSVALLDLILGLGVDLLVNLVLGNCDSSVLSGNLVDLLGTVRALALGQTSVGGGVGNILGIVLGVSSVDSLSLFLKIVLGEVGLLVPGVVGGGTVNVLQRFLRWTHALRSVSGSVASYVAEEDSGILHCIVC
jgi:hypothetical protein